jgi:hypothetical protein
MLSLNPSSINAIMAGITPSLISVIINKHRDMSHKINERGNGGDSQSRSN